MTKKPKAQKKRDFLKRAQKKKQKKARTQPAQKRAVGMKEIYINNCRIVYDPITDEYSSLAPPDIEKEISHDLYIMAGKEPRKALSRLLELKTLYPEHTRIYNFLAKAYITLGSWSRAKKILEESYRRNPEYLFAKVNYASICMQHGEAEKVPAIMENKFDLGELYPHRNEFHVTEAVAFYGIIGLYQAETGELVNSRAMLQLLEDLDPDAEMTWELRRRIIAKTKSLPGA